MGSLSLPLYPEMAWLVTALTSRVSGNDAIPILDLTLKRIRLAFWEPLIHEVGILTTLQERPPHPRRNLESSWIEKQHDKAEPSLLAIRQKRQVLNNAIVAPSYRNSHQLSNTELPHVA